MPVAVVDASLALKWVLLEPFSAEADALLGEWQAAETRLLAPSLLMYEATNVLYRKGAPYGLPVQELHRAFALLLRTVELRIPDVELAHHAAVMAALLKRSASYDTYYLALAEREGCELWTADERFWRAAQPHFPSVRWIGERAAATR
jgi:predicted nucleic acid-binding protein